MTAPVLHAPTELVAVAWIDSIPTFRHGITGTQLPADETIWGDTGYITVAAVGGNPNIWVPKRQPVVQVDCWATNPGSNKPPWGQAAALASQIISACYDFDSFGRELHPSLNGVAYPTCRCLAAYTLTEPHRVYGDVGDYAGASFDLQLHWVEIDR